MARSADRDRKRAAGHLDIFCWLDPEAKEALLALHGKMPGQSRGAIVGKALKQMAKDAPPTADAIEDRLAALEKNVSILMQSGTPLSPLAPQEPSAPPPLNLQSPQEAAAGGIAKSKRRKIDADALIERIVERRLQDGDDFSFAALHRELQAEGFPVYKNAGHLANFAKKHEKTIAAMVAKRTSDNASIDI